jgi:hypothetical protein
MRPISPTAEGFKLVFRRPSIPLAEIAWRWSFAAAAWFLSAMYLFVYADTLSLNTVDLNAAAGPDCSRDPADF